MTDFQPEIFLENLFKAGLAAADPRVVLPRYLPDPPKKGRTIVIGAGKAGGAMAKAVEDHWNDELEGLVVTRYDYSLPTERIKVIEAAHPVPDEAGQQAAIDIRRMVEGLSEDDLVLCLISGGGSALLSAPAPCLSAEEKRALTKKLLKSGATIHEINIVRKHLSLIKGGQLGKAAAPARLHTLLVSDVSGDDPDVIASGPTLPDPSTQAQALAIIEKYRIGITDEIRAYLSDPANETPKPGDAYLESGTVEIIAKARDSLEAAAKYARAQGVEPIILGDAIEGEARAVGAAQVREVLQHKGDRPVVFLSGGETTVTVTGNGRGGRNSEYLLGAVIEAAGQEGLYGLACDTDGIDGMEDNAGAIFTPDIWAQAQQKGLDPATFLHNNDAYSVFEAMGGLIKTGPTFTNVNDFRALLLTGRT